MPKFRHSSELPPAAVTEAAGRPGRADSAVQAAGGLLATLGMVGLFAAIWLANLASCFGGAFSHRAARTAASDAVGPAPRAPDPTDPTDTALVRPLARMWVALGRPADSLAVWVLDDSTINAASLGNGRFVVWRGLSALPPDAREAVYAHELAHDELGHVRQASDMADVADWLGQAVGTLGGGDEAATLKLRQWSGALVMPRYSRAQELEADSTGVVVLRRLGVDHADTRMCQALEALRSRVGDDDGGFFASHPALSARIARLRGTSPSGC